MLGPLVWLDVDMTRNIRRLDALFFLLVTVPLTFAQDLQSHAAPFLSSDIFGPQPIAWSQLQEPQPTARTFIGMIERNSGGYVLKVSRNSSYQLEDQGKARQYEGRQVKIVGTIVGTVDTNSDRLQIISIEIS
jgi:hypothetical protein